MYYLIYKKLICCAWTSNICLTRLISLFYLNHLIATYSSLSSHYNNDDGDYNVY